MPANMLEPLVENIVSSAARTATGNSGNLTLKAGESHAFYLNVSAASGTTPTLDVAIQISTDRGTTYRTAARFAQVTAVTARRLQLQQMMGRGEAGTESVVTATGGALSANTPLTRDYRILWTITGTTPSFTFTVDLVTMPRTGGVY